MSNGVDVEIMRQIATGLFVPVVYQAFGEIGTAALREVLAFLPRHYERASPELVTGTLLVVRSLTPDAVVGAIAGDSRTEARIERLPREVDSLTVVELLDTGAFRVWEDATVNLDAATTVAVVYRFTPGREDFVVHGTSHAVLNPAPGHLSVFARPTFTSLADALEDYRRNLIRTSNCYIFRETWEDQNHRLFFNAGPEWRMRRSLQQFLQARLRDVDVLAEQIVDESHPVDVKVMWNFTRSEALIEIKWLGKSRNNGKIVAYWDARALEGAGQLADYLDKYHTSNPTVDARGYLVVIDARRYGVADDATGVSKAKGMRYADAEIEFDPKYHEVRNDFAEPIRMFAEPICDPEETAA